jgi:peptidoglycan hydrolase FlgJ
MATQPISIPLAATPLSIISNASAAAAVAASKPITSGKSVPSASDRAHAQATDFEAMFLSSMTQEMFTDIGKEGPLGNATGVGVWRTFLTNEFGKSIAKSGGVGIAKQVYKSLMAHQEAQAKADPEQKKPVSPTSHAVKARTTYQPLKGI